MNSTENEIYHQHCYGSNYFWVKSKSCETLLGKFCNESSRMPLVSDQLEFLYDELLKNCLNLFFPREKKVITTRMKEIMAEGVLESDFLDENSKVVLASIARAGIIPSQQIFKKLHLFFHPENLRQDHFYLSRKVNEKNEVIGVNHAGSKVGGDAADSIVICPDPMGATGSTIDYTYHYYQNLSLQKPLAIVALHLIVTPEYLLRMKNNCPEIKVVFLRRDRGLSSEKALQEIPGKLWASERGLNDHDYIVPGAGGIGEILNNSFC